MDATTEKVKVGAWELDENGVWWRHYLAERWRGAAAVGKRGEWKAFRFDGTALGGGPPDTFAPFNRVTVGMRYADAALRTIPGIELAADAPTEVPTTAPEVKVAEVSNVDRVAMNAGGQIVVDAMRRSKVARSLMLGEVESTQGTPTEPQPMPTLPAAEVAATLVSPPVTSTNVAHIGLGAVTYRGRRRELILTHVERSDGTRGVVADLIPGGEFELSMNQAAALSEWLQRVSSEVK